MAWGSILLALTAIVAAYIAASTANYRMERQLDEESKRLNQQLDHDRRMRDRDELRRLLDEVAMAGSSAFNQIMLARAATPGLGFEVGEGPHALGKLQSREEALAAAHQKVWALAGEGGRLILRFGPNHLVCRSFWALRDGLVKLIALVDVDEVERTPGQSQLIDERLEALSGTNKKFVDACRSQIRVG